MSETDRDRRDETWRQGDEASARAEAEHDPALEPYASMSRDQILELMHRPENRERWCFLNEFLKDRMTAAELECHEHAMNIARFLMNEYDVSGNAQCVWLCELGGGIARHIAEEMPPIGPPEVCN